MHKKVLVSVALGAAILASLSPISAALSRAEAACLGPYNAVPDPVACAAALHPQDFSRLLVPGLSGRGAGASTLLGWVAGEVLSEREVAALPFTGIEIESTVKSSSIDIDAAVIAELQPGVSISANVNYFDDESIEDLRGSVGLDITF